MSVLEQIRYQEALERNSVTRGMLAEEFNKIESDYDKGYALEQIISHLELDKKQGRELYPLHTAWRVIRAMNLDSYGLRD
jgi:hypothetical protein